MHSLIVINFSFVLLFGIILSLSFADIGFKKNIDLKKAEYKDWSIKDNLDLLK